MVLEVKLSSTSSMNVGVTWNEWVSANLNYFQVMGTTDGKSKRF